MMRRVGEDPPSAPAEAWALRMLFVGFVIASGVVGCGPGKDEQCRTLVQAVEKGHAVRKVPQSTDAEAFKRYVDAMVEVQADLSRTNVTDTRLVELRDAEAENLQNFVFAQRQIHEARIDAELAEGEGRRQRVMSRHDENIEEIGDYCGVALELAPLPANAPSAFSTTESSAPAPSGTAGATATGAGTQEPWIAFRHPSAGFEAQFFSEPELGEKKGSSSLTRAAIVNDDHRMFSAAHIELLSPALYDCRTIVDVHVKGKERDLGCKRLTDSISGGSGEATLDVTLRCSDGATLMKRVRCTAEEQNAKGCPPRRRSDLPRALGSRGSQAIPRHGEAHRPLDKSKNPSKPPSPGTAPRGEDLTRSQRGPYGPSTSEGRIRYKREEAAKSRLKHGCAERI